MVSFKGKMRRIMFGITFAFLTCIGFLISHFDKKPKKDEWIITIHTN